MGLETRASGFTLRWKAGSRGGKWGGMEVVLKHPAAKYNWGVILPAVDSGMPLKEVSAKFSVPMGSLKDKVNRVRREAALQARAVGEYVKGMPAPNEFPCQVVNKKQEISAPEIPAPSELSETQLVSLLSDPSAIHALPAAEAEKLFARRLQSLVAQGLADMRAPASPKELGPMAKLFREMSGLTGDKGKGSNGLLAPPRSFGRRPVAVIDVPPVVEEPEGGWPEGME